MGVKRMRVFAGPNGSGKTTLVNDLNKEIPFGIYINAVDIEAQLNQDNFIDLQQYKIHFTTYQLQEFILNNNFSINKIDNKKFIDSFSIENNKLIIQDSNFINSYVAADIADFIRNLLLHNSTSFSYETVMSHPSKIDFIKLAQEKVFKTYLYYIATESPEINVSRVKVRVAQNLHNVPEKTIINRYYKSLNNLKEAVKYTDRTFLFDNSNKFYKFIGEISNGIDVKIVDTNFIPNWASEYLFNK